MWVCVWFLPNLSCLEVFPPVFPLLAPCEHLSPCLAMRGVRERVSVDGDSWRQDMWDFWSVGEGAILRPADCVAILGACALRMVGETLYTLLCVHVRVRVRVCVM